MDTHISSGYQSKNRKKRPKGTALPSPVYLFCLQLRKVLREKIIKDLSQTTAVFCKMLIKSKMRAVRFIYDQRYPFPVGQFCKRTDI